MSLQIFADYEEGRFEISETVGFLLEEPLEFLPSYFDSWNHLAKEMPNLVKQCKLREAVNEMPLLDHTRLESYAQKRLGHLQLSLIGSGYVWQEGDAGVPKSIPKCLAVPWYKISQELGIKPILAHSALVLANYKKGDPERTLELENLKCIYNIPGGSVAEWFITVTVQIELDFCKIIKHIMSALRYVVDQNEAGLLCCLNGILESLRIMKRHFSQIHERLTAETFYDTVRPFLAGWGGVGSALPEGLIYEGVSDSPLKMLGGSAAQSSSLQTLDAALGIEHQPERQKFLTEMREFMPPAHRKFIIAIEEAPSIRAFVNDQQSPELVAAYNSCIRAVTEFRSYHIQIVTKYIIIRSNMKDRNKSYENLAKRGTGGSSLLPFLKDIRRTTKEHSLAEDADGLVLERDSSKILALSNGRTLVGECKKAAATNGYILE